jgi:hypothetical protein
MGRVECPQSDEVLLRGLVGEQWRANSTLAARLAAGMGALALNFTQGRMETDGAAPDGLDLLHDQGMGQEVLGRGADGDLEGRAS